MIYYLYHNVEKGALKVMRQQAAKQILTDLMEWQLKLETVGSGTQAKEQQLFMKEQQQLLDELMDQLETQYDLSDYADEQWTTLRTTWEESLIEAERHRLVKQHAKAADHSKFRYLSVVETGEARVINGKSQLSLSAFPHDKPETLEEFKVRYLQEPYHCYQLDLTVPEVRAHLGLDAQ